MTANRISRTRIIEGVAMPAFIHNGGFYFLVNLQVFADGLVDCWELVDLEDFREKIRDGWIVTDPPAGEEISVHGLAAWSIREAAWDLTADDLHERVIAKVKDLNPRMENLWRGPVTERIDGIEALLHAPERPLRSTEPAWTGRRVDGDNLSVLVRDTDRGDDFHLVDLRIFADGVVEIGRLAKPETTDLEGLAAAVAEGRIVASAPRGTRVRIHGLGSFHVEDEHWSVDPRELVREAHDLVATLNGRPDSLDRCRAAHEAYLADPTEETKEALRAAYEAVPKHNRMYVGDMDTKDSEVRAILFGAEKIES